MPPKTPKLPEELERIKNLPFYEIPGLSRADAEAILKLLNDAALDFGVSLKDLPAFLPNLMGNALSNVTAITSTLGSAIAKYIPMKEAISAMNAPRAKQIGKAWAPFLYYWWRPARYRAKVFARTIAELTKIHGAEWFNEGVGYRALLDSVSRNFFPKVTRSEAQQIVRMYAPEMRNTNLPYDKNLPRDSDGLPILHATSATASARAAVPAQTAKPRAPRSPAPDPKPRAPRSPAPDPKPRAPRSPAPDPTKPATVALDIERRRGAALDRIRELGDTPKTRALAGRLAKV